MAEFQITFFLDNGLTVEATVPGASYEAVANDMAERLGDNGSDVVFLYQRPHATLIRRALVRYCTIIPLGAEGDRYGAWYDGRGGTDVLVG